MKQSKLVIAFLILVAVSLHAAELTGTVNNATTGKPVADAEVVLLRLQQGMDEVARTKSDAQGRFKFDVKDEQAQHLVRVNYQKANYHRPAPPGATDIEIEVYDSTADAKGISSPVVVMQLQARDDVLEVVETYGLRNSSQPPRTWMGDHTLEFTLPAGATLVSGSAMGPGGMGVNSTPFPLGDNRFAFIFPVRPGETRFQVAYTLPYTGQLTLKPRVEFTADNVAVMVPKSMKFDAPRREGSFVPVMDEEGASVYAASKVARGKEPEFTVSGTGTLAALADAPAAQGGENGPGGGLGPPTETPDPLYQYRWYILGGFALVLGVTAFVITQRGKESVVSEAAASRPAAVAVPPMGGILGALKEELFQLEMDRAQQKISAEEYSKAKAALELTLARALARESRG